MIRAKARERALEEQRNTQNLHCEKSLTSDPMHNVCGNLQWPAKLLRQRAITVQRPEEVPTALCHTYMY